MGNSNLKREIFVRSIFPTVDKTFSVVFEIDPGKDLTCGMLTEIVLEKLRRLNSLSYGISISRVYKPRADGTPPPYTVSQMQNFMLDIRLK
jgi:hypothetical protein